ncbi:hypothetical protein UA08_08896 [Talaromyces atroroseus]|uniref:Uncharacterized protein n=1 Tax=Talaromyces atroroseus TaxID=1441469 RepID=A0A225AFP2_TALAT|nr:hypothetical protein UA08_08896 [Talaromyces atroroseus]OKL55778.1 hypothetical protein UA08_08896 [Talaromyces atroroseus]
MFDDPDRMNDFQFSQLHKRVLKLDGHHSNPMNIDSHCEIDYMDAFGRTPLYWAIERGDLAAVLTLLGAGAGPNIPTPRAGWTSMHFVARSHTTPLSRALRHGDGAAKIKALIAGGADPNLQYDETRWTASHLAMFLGRTECVRDLLESGADFSLKTVMGSNVVHFAARYGDLEMVQLLREFESILGKALTECPRDTLHDLQDFRRERYISAITDTWWSVWSDLIRKETLEQSINYGAVAEPQTDTNDLSWEDEADYEDAVEYL